MFQWNRNNCSDVARMVTLPILAKCTDITLSWILPGDKRLLKLNVNKVQIEEVKRKYFKRKANV